MFDLKGNLSKLAEELKKDKKDEIVDMVVSLIRDTVGILLTKDQVFNFIWILSTKNHRRSIFIKP